MDNTPPTAPQSDLRELVGHRECVQGNDSLEVVQKRFAAHEHEFMAVLNGERLAGLCSREKIGMVLGARFGFAMNSHKPVREFLLPEMTTVRVDQSVPEVLTLACSRPHATLYDDVPLLDESGTLLGVIFSRTLVRLQNALWQEKILQLETKQRELNAKNAELEGDLHLAREIQFAMLPGNLPDVSNGQLSFHFCHRYQPAGVVSGDFFHLVKMSDDTVGIFICDVMGHGVRSAFVTATLRALVEEMRPVAGNPGELLTRINTELMCILKPMGSPLYATAFYLTADVASGEIRFASAGHPNPLLLHRRTGETRRLNCPAGAKGPALGLIAGAKYGNAQDRLAADDFLLLFTDGVAEVFDAGDNEFGATGLMAGMSARRELPADKLVDGLLADARNHSAHKNFDDDICVVGIEAAAI
jgi:serine phosphatase RsbU (regulator of sigma subunit)